MNVLIDSNFSTAAMANTDTDFGTYNMTTTYRPATRTQGVWGSGYLLDIADKVMDDEAYKGQGLTAEDIMQQAGNLNVHAQKDFMVVMSNCVSGEDLQKMKEEGFAPGSTDVETYVSIVDKIKVTLAKAGVEIAGYNDDLDAAVVEEITGSKVDANALAKDMLDAFNKNDIPVTDENVAQLAQAVAKASGIDILSDDALKYLILNQKTPTIDNIYKAQFSSAANIKQAQGYYSEGNGNYGKYYTRKADTINWDNIKTQVESVVKQSGYSINNEQAVENAKWLVEAGIELNSENLTKLSELKNIELPMSQQAMLEMCITAMENGKAPQNALMTGEKSIAQAAKELVDIVNNISNEAIHEAVESGVKINIKNLAACQESLNQKGIENIAQANISETDSETMTAQPIADNNSHELRELQARRQLEEIRLMMSEEANRHLLKSGISIDTTELSKLVEQLKSAEESIKAALFQGENVAQNVERAAIYDETIIKTKELASMPSALIGKMVASSRVYTLSSLHQEGKELQNQLENQNQSSNHSSHQQKQAMESYETLMTAPRKDLGDKISKAFRNVDAILDDMSLEKSEANRRAVRILGYNSMEITKENIDAVKQADAKVCGVIEKMTPATTLQMIREQKNPLEMTMEELDAYLSANSKDLGDETERYSKFLQKLDKSNAITSEEREAYIGIYRMFRQIEKTDGAVIGSLVATGAQMNFKNMLSAVRTSAAQNSNKNMDYRIDDGFGGLEELILKGKAIDTQIMSGYASQNGDNSKNEEASYYAKVSEDINNELANKTDLEALKDVPITADTTIEAFSDAIKAIPLDENADIIKEQKAQELKEFRQSINDVKKVEDEIIQTLIDYGQTISIDNIEAASMLIMDRGSLFRQIFANKNAKAAEDDISQSESEEENSEIDSLWDAADSLIENLTDKKSANVSYEELIMNANKAVENMISNQTGYLDVKAAKSLYKGLALSQNMAREENYEIPVNINGEITSINLKICHNISKMNSSDKTFSNVASAKVAITMDTDSYGKVAAEFEVVNNRVSGMIVYDDKDNKLKLEHIEERVKESISSDDKQISVNLVYANNIDLNKFGEDYNASDIANNTSTADLYKIAKSFIMAVKEN